MPQYLISFPASAMQVPEADMPAVGVAANAVCEEAAAAGVLVFAGGLDETVPVAMVSGDGTAVDGTYPETRNLNGGMTVVDVPTRDEALVWAAKIATACRCAQEVRQLF